MPSIYSCVTTAALTLRIVHVREEHFSRVSSVRHKRREHLPDFSHEKRFTSREGADGQPVDFGILSEP